MSEEFYLGGKATQYEQVITQVDEWISNDHTQSELTDGETTDLIIDILRLDGNKTSERDVLQLIAEVVSAWSKNRKHWH